MAKTPAAVRDLLDAVWAPARARALADRDAHAGAGRARRAATSRSPPGTGATTPRSCASGAATSTRRRSSPTSSSTASSRRRSTRRSRLFGLTFDAAHGRAGLASRRAGLGGARRATARTSALFFGDYFARPSKRSGAWMTLAARPGEARRRHPPAGRQRDELHQGAGRRADAAVASTTRARCSTSSATRCTACSPTSPIRRSPAPACAPISSSCPRSSTSTGWSSRRCCGASRCTTETGEPMPEALLQQAARGAHLQPGLRDGRIRRLGAGRSRPASRCRPPRRFDVDAFEQSALRRIGMPDEIVMRHRPPHFAHIFSGGGYASAYYSYMWSEVLDADAFAAFEETGDIFDPATAKRLHDTIYSAGGSRDPAELYTAFRGRLPTPDALLKKRGCSDAKPAAAAPDRSTSPSRAGEARVTDHGSMDLHTAGHRRGVVCAPHAAAVEAGRADPGRGRQCARGHGGDGGDDRRRLSAHEPHRRRRLLAGARAVGPRARHHGGRPGRRATRGRSSTATTRPIPPRGPLAALTVPGAIAGWMLALEAAKAHGGKLPLDVLLAPPSATPATAIVVTRSQTQLTRKPSGRAQGRAGLRRDVPGRRQAAGGRHDAEAAGARRDARPSRPCRARRFLSRRCRPRDRRRSRTHRQPGDARRS